MVLLSLPSYLVDHYNTYHHINIINSFSFHHQLHNTVTGRVIRAEWRTIRIYQTPCQYPPLVPVQALPLTTLSSEQLLRSFIFYLFQGQPRTWSSVSCLTHQTAWSVIISPHSDNSHTLQSPVSTSDQSYGRYTSNSSSLDIWISSLISWYLH